MAYNLLKPVHIINAASMAVTITSPAVEIRLQDNVGIQLDWTGAPTGAFAIQVSLDHLEDMEGNIQVPGHWIDLLITPAIVAAGTPDDVFIELSNQTAMYIRIVYTAAGGAGTLDAFIAGKAI